MSAGFIRSLVRRARLLRLQFVGIRLGTGIVCRSGVSVSLGMRDGRRGSMAIGDGSELERGVVVRCFGGDLRIGHRVHVGPYSVIYAHGGVDIGDDTLIGPRCTIVAADHQVPALDRCIRWEPDVRAPVVIGRDVWLGTGVTVLRGVCIGDGAVIGANSLVRTDVPPGAIAVGNPLRVIGQRSAAS